jgi:Ca2+-binding EF-hand superfamily protein
MTTKHVRFTVLSTLAALTLSALPAMADANATKGPEARFEKLVAHFDKNGDGKLQVSELPARMLKRLGKADADGDGVITSTEYTAQIEAARDARKARMDTDHDGKISDAERAAARESRMKARFSHIDKNNDGQIEPGEAGARRWERIAPADTDKNGAVSFAEMEQAIANGTVKLGHHHSKKTDNA